jgi:hypothetical protein
VPACARRFAGKTILVSPGGERPITLSIVHRFKRPEIAVG